MMILQHKSLGLEIWNAKVTSQQLFQSIEKVSLSATTMKKLNLLLGDVFEFHPGYIENLL